MSEKAYLIKYRDTDFGVVDGIMLDKFAVFYYAGKILKQSQVNILKIDRMVSEVDFIHILLYPDGTGDLAYVLNGEKGLKSYVDNMKILQLLRRDSRQVSILREELSEGVKRVLVIFKKGKYSINEVL